MSLENQIFVVDDDVDIRESMTALLESAGYKVKAYGSAREFLLDQPKPGACVITDVRMPEMDGIALQKEIANRSLELPVIVITGHGDVPLAVSAMKAGAVDFVEKPFDDEVMLSSVRHAIEVGRRSRDRAAEAKLAQDLLSLLTPREKSVLEKLVAGRSNKVAAYELGISPRTIELHRAHIMEKMKARNLSDLVRISIAAAPN